MMPDLTHSLETSMQFHILSFEGPDAYSRDGGIASRISGLSAALAAAGFETHLWFVGDPYGEGHEIQGNLHLRRWCQWLSQYHPGGVYDGEESKRLDYVSSLPPFLMHEHLLSHLSSGGRATVVAEEWHTVDAVLYLDWLLRCAGMRQQVTILRPGCLLSGLISVPAARCMLPVQEALPIPHALP